MAHAADFLVNNNRGSDGRAAVDATADQFK